MRSAMVRESMHEDVCKEEFRDKGGVPLTERNRFQEEDAGQCV